jgi:ribonuclease HI
MLETEDLVKERMWVIYVDGSSTKKNGGDGVVLITSDAEELCSSLNLEFKTTNNEA